MSAAVGRALVGLGLARVHHPDGQAQERVDLAHPLRVALGQVLVGRDDVHAATGQRVEVDGHGRGEGLALTGLHLGDVAVVQRGAAEDLDVVGPLEQDPVGRLAHDREGLDLDLEQRHRELVLGGVLGQTGTELVGLGPQLVVGEFLHLRFAFVDGVDDALELFGLAALPSTEDLVEHGHGSQPFFETRLGVTPIRAQGRGHRHPPRRTARGDRWYVPGGGFRTALRRRPLRVRGRDDAAGVR